MREKSTSAKDLDRTPERVDRLNKQTVRRREDTGRRHEVEAEQARHKEVKPAQKK